LGALLLAMSDFLDPGRGPEQRGDFRISPTFFVVLVLGGFVVGAIGHLVRSRAVTAIGVGMIFLATVLLPVALGLSR
jgi:hypothetical protein